ncbi:hypothetical protein DSO57_1016321 [Entomophthora muscae]|uniref:Uncharacterized protein n=1 Tax=Entomophthora muscae TaxID=34485 RepID=A0ACC2STZ6_9FUNG|nr:hypothetical protein DSO57_1016321 [Entomophthora muscae]
MVTGTCSVDWNAFDAISQTQSKWFKSAMLEKVESMKFFVLLVHVLGANALVWNDVKATFEKLTATPFGFLKYFQSDAVRLTTPQRDHNITAASVNAFLPISLIATCSMQQLNKQACFCSKFTFVKRIYNQAKDAVAVVAQSTDMVIVAFRQTASEKNNESDMDFALTPLPGVGGDVKVHKGFLEYYQSLQAELEQLLPTLLANNTKLLHLTGYSLGGAVALISLDSILRKLRLENKVQVYSYANPRVGNRAFANHIESLNVPVIRYTILNDLVSQLPPKNMGYIHTGIEYFSSKSTLTKCSLEFDEDPSCAHSGTSLTKDTHTKPNQQPMPKPIFCVSQV